MHASDCSAQKLYFNIPSDQLDRLYSRYTTSSNSSDSSSPRPINSSCYGSPNIVIVNGSCNSQSRNSGIKTGFSVPFGNYK